jgi:hypothetical protein
VTIVGKVFMNFCIRMVFGTLDGLATVCFETSGWICFGFALFCERLMVSCYDREIPYCSFSASNAQLQFDFLALPFLSTIRSQDRGATAWCAVSDLRPSQLAEVSTAIKLS